MYVYQFGCKIFLRGLRVQTKKKEIGDVKIRKKKNQ